MNFRLSVLYLSRFTVVLIVSYSYFNNSYFKFVSTNDGFTFKLAISQTRAIKEGWILFQANYPQSSHSCSILLL